MEVLLYSGMFRGTIPQRLNNAITQLQTDSSSKLLQDDVTFPILRSSTVVAVTGTSLSGPLPPLVLRRPPGGVAGLCPSPELWESTRTHGAMRIRECCWEG